MTRADAALTLFVTAVWGVAFVGIKEVISVAPPLTAAGARFVLAGLLLLPLVLARAAGGAGRGARGTAEGGSAGGGSAGGGSRRPTLRQVVVVGLLQTAGLYGFGFLGVERATAGASALLINTNPVMVAVLAVPLLGERVTGRMAAGVACSMAGVVVVAFSGHLGSALGVTLLLLAALSWALASIVVKRWPGIDLLTLTAGQMLAGGLPLLVAGIVTEHRLPEVTGKAVFWFVFLVVPSTALNFVLWFRLLGRYGAVAMTSWLFLIPLFGVVSGWLLLGENLGWRLAAGGALVVLGLRLTQPVAARGEIPVTAPG